MRRRFFLHALVYYKVKLFFPQATKLCKWNNAYNKNGCSSIEWKELKEDTFNFLRSMKVIVDVS